jgi:hypothetical protein
MSNPKKGDRFLHLRVLDVRLFDGKTPQLYQVTRVARGCVYYRPVYNRLNGEDLGSCEYCLLETFPKIAAMEEAQ